MNRRLAKGLTLAGYVAFAVMATDTHATGRPAAGKPQCRAHACVTFSNAAGQTTVTFTQRTAAPALCYIAVNGFRRVFMLEDTPSVWTLSTGYHYTQVSWRCDAPSPKPQWLS